MSEEKKHSPIFCIAFDLENRNSVPVLEMSPAIDLQDALDGFSSDMGFEIRGVDVFSDDEPHVRAGRIASIAEVDEGRIRYYDPKNRTPFAWEDQMICIHGECTEESLLLEEEY